MLTSLIDRLGDWNPQLFRELKGRLNQRNVYLIIAGSLAGQYLMYQIYQDSVDDVLNIILPFLLIVGVMYLVSKDIAEEEQQGTLNFIRLSPQSSQSILLGKFLGVPSLVYLGIGLALPLHTITGLIHHHSIFFLGASYSLWIASSWLFYNLALSYSLLISSYNGSKYSASTIAGVVLLLSIFLTAPYLQILENFWLKTNNLDWFFIPIGQKPLLSYFWLLLSISMAAKFIWIANNRRLCNPNSTLISKSQSYQLVTSLQVWILGFVLSHDLSNYAYEGGLIWLLGFTPFIFLILIAILSPNHQALLDWSKYRHQIIPRKNRSLWQDLIWGEKSPPIGAIAVNFIITALIWSLWLFLLPQSAFEPSDLGLYQVLLALVLTLGIMLIYGLIFQIILLLKTPKPETLATGTVTALAILPLAGGGMLALSQIHLGFLWVFSPLPLFIFVQGSNLTAIVGLFLQLGIIVGLTKVLQQRLYLVAKVDNVSPPQPLYSKIMTD